MADRNVTLRVDGELYDQYRSFCKERGVLMSRQFERFMEAQLKGSKNTTTRGSQ